MYSFLMVILYSWIILFGLKSHLMNNRDFFCLCLGIVMMIIENFLMIVIYIQQRVFLMAKGIFIIRVE